MKGRNYVAILTVIAILVISLYKTLGDLLPIIAFTPLGLLIFVLLFLLGIILLFSAIKKMKK